MKRLPVDVSDFQTMIEDGYVYVDKTEIIYQLITRRRLYFLSRPRRFGKSVLISTLRELFSGNKKLFANTWIGQKSNYEWIKYPVIHLDFSSLSCETLQEFKISLSRELESIGESFKIDIATEPLLTNKLQRLVRELAQKNKVVILIDEYDYPILSSLLNDHVARELHKTLKSFFATIKAMDKYLHAVFLTGVTKFAKTSIFSGMNNLDDITMDSEAAALLGYTDDEINANFSKYLELAAHHNELSSKEFFEKVKYWYNGYQFSIENIKVYNPFSVLRCLDKKRFANYWFETGTPSFLVNIIKNQYSSIENIETTELSASSLGTFNIDNLPLIPLLLQAGYLTIHEYDATTDRYKLGYPNHEVQQSFKTYLIASLVQTTPSGIELALSYLKSALHTNNIDLFCSTLRNLFANIPYQLHIKKEAYYHSLFQLLINLLGLEGQSEVSSSNGRIDMVLIIPKRIIIFEIKFKGTVRKALQQIEKQRYVEKYLHHKKPITLVGLSFNVKNKELILDWITKDL